MVITICASATSAAAGHFVSRHNGPKYGLLLVVLSVNTH